MPINPTSLLNRVFPAVEQAVTERDCMLYSLSLGFGKKPLDRNDLRFVYEKNLEVFPTMPVILGLPAPWMHEPNIGINRKMVLHGGQSLRLHKPLTANVISRTENRIGSVIDRGKDRGAVIQMVRSVFEKSTGDLVAEIQSTIMARADGGFGGDPGPEYEYVAVPSGAPDNTIDLATEPDQALLYRLNGDYNPLHADPDVAAAAGFDQPILHGLCTFGLAARALLIASGASAHLASIECRFSRPVFPGETVTFELWRRSAGISFRALVNARGATVLDRGRASFQS